MDGQKFDKLTRAFAAGIDRRTLLKIFGGATLTGVAGVSVARPSGVFAQGTVEPGGECTTDEDCAQGTCFVETEGEPGVCACEDPAEPWIGCTCNTGTESPCGGGTPVCCPPNQDDPPGTDGTCSSGMTGCQYPEPTCSEPDSSCEESGCCTEGECGANGWCTSCISGTEDPCGNLNEAFGADFICCTYGGDPGSVGICVTEAECIVEPPNTGAGATSGGNSWIAPAAAVGAAAAVLAYKSRERNAENEA